MADNANQINGTEPTNTFVNGSHTPNTNTYNIANALNGLNTSTNNATDQLLDRISFTLAFTEMALGAAEFVWMGDENANKVAKKAIHHGARTIIKPEGRVEGRVERQVQRVWALVVLLREQGFWQWGWHRIRHFIVCFWVLFIRPCILFVLRWLGFGRRVAPE
jgi:hypothetical protein